MSECLTRIQQLGDMNEFSEITGSALKKVFPSPRRSGWRKWGLAALLMVPILAIAIWGSFVHRDPIENNDSAGEAKPLAVADPPVKDYRTFKNELSMKFNPVPKGVFPMGGAAGKPGEMKVAIRHDFYMGVYEVTQEEWELVMGLDENPSQYARFGERYKEVASISDEELKHFPVDHVSWLDCQKFVNLLNAHINEPGWTYRLPTSVEWEYACRGGPIQETEEYGYDFYFDTPSNSLSPEKANWFGSKINRTCKVGSYPPNRLGLYDMHGNVFEYCSDGFGEGDNISHVMRGGWWKDKEENCRTSQANLGNQACRYDGAGFRLARVPIGGKQ